MKLWLDDVRTPPDSSWTWVTGVEDAKTLIRHAIIAEVEIPFEAASLDHDLGACGACLGGKTWEEWLIASHGQSMPHCAHIGTGYDLVCWMERHGYWPQTKPVVHSANPVGRARMQQAITRAWEDR